MALNNTQERDKNWFLTINAIKARNANKQTTNLDPITYNSRYPWFDEANYRKLESKIDQLGLTGYEKEQAMDELYVKALPIVQNEIKNSDRRKIINQNSYEASQIKDKSARTMAKSQMWVVELTQQLKEKFNIDPSAPDEDVFNSWISSIPNWEQLLVNYLNDWDRELLYVWWLETPTTTPEPMETSVWGMQSIINKQSETSNDTTLWKINNILDWWNILGKWTQRVDNLVQKIPVVDGQKQAENLAKKMNNLTENDLNNLYDKYLRMVRNGSKEDNRWWWELLWDWITWDQQAIDRINTLQLADYSEAMPQDWVERNQRGNQLWDTTLGSSEESINNAIDNSNLNKVGKWIAKSWLWTADKLKNLINFVGWSWWGLENYAEAAWVGLQQMDDIRDKRWYIPQDIETNEDAFKAFVADKTANFGERALDAPDMLMWRTLSPNVVKFASNIPWSFLKTLSSKIRAKTNPLDTKIWLAKMLFTEEWQQAMINRYWDIEKLSHTMDTDPVWFASDIIDWWDKINRALNKTTGGKVERQNIQDVTDILSTDAVKGLNQSMNFISDWTKNKWWDKTSWLVDIERDAAFNPTKLPWDIAKESGMIARDVADMPWDIQSWFRESANRVVQNINRMTKKQQEKFKQMSGGIDQWEFQNKRWLKTLDDLSDHFTKNLEQVDAAMDTIQGRFKSKQLDAVVNDVVEYATDTEDPQAWRLQELAKKNAEWGLEMNEINEIKRYYERTTIFDYLKDTSGSKKARTATNRDSALREWQYKVAEDAGLDNLPELNKETQLTKYILDNASDWSAGVKGNNPISLTDWIVAAGGGLSMKWIESLVGKKVYQSRWFQEWLVDVLNYLWGREVEEWPTVDMDKIVQRNQERAEQDRLNAIQKAQMAEELSRVRNEKEFKAWLNKAQEMAWPALPHNPQYDNQEPIDYTDTTTVTPWWQSVRRWQIAEINNTNSETNLLKPTTQWMDEAANGM